MRKYLSFVLCLLIGVNVFAQNQVLKAVAATSNQNFKVAETPLMTKVSNTQANSLGETYLENEAFYTNYDLQSNSFISNRMYQNKNGDVAVVAMQSDDESSAAADRGTGYNFYKNGKILEGGDQFQKIEANATGADMRTGWPSIAPYGAEGEIMVCHTGNGLVYYTRTKAGEGVWDGPYNVPNLKAGTTDLTLSWPKIITTGANNETVHIFAAATTDEGTAQLYLRSSDLQNWEYSWAPCSLHNLHVGVYDADDYAVAANGDVIAVVYNNWQKAHTMLYKSYDNGNTWESKIIWENPIHLLDWETDEGTIFEQFCAPTHVSVALDKYGDAHAALSVGMFYHDELGTSYSIYYGIQTDGVAYWYEGYGMPLQSPDGNPWNALKLWWEDEENLGYITLNPQNFCAWMPPHNEDGWAYFESSKQYTGSQGSSAGDYQSSFGLSAYPSIAVDPAGNIAVAYSAPDLNLGDLWYDSQTGNEYYYRSLFVNYKPAGTTDWTSVTVYGQSLDECTYVTAVSNPVNENEFWFSCLSDDTPGFHYGNSASQDHITTSTVNVFKFCPDGIDEDFEGFDTPLTISVNPANSGNVTIAGANMLGKTVTLSATPNEGYRFLNWTENGEVISTNAQYSFTISKEMNLVANFIIDTYVPPMKNVAKECVLIEAFTGINCAYCPAAAVAITQMINEDLPIAPLAFHSSYFTPSDSDYATSETDSRSSWYKVTGYPTIIIDGVESHAGGGPASAYSSVYYKVKEEYEKRVNIGSPYEIELTYENTLNEGVAKAVVKKVNDNASNDVRLFIALAESHIQQNWGGGLSELNAVVRDILTSTSGVKLVGNINEYTASFSFNNEWNKENCYIVAWVQDIDSKEVYQAVKISVNSESYPEQPSNYWTPDESLYANNMTIITTIEIDGVEAASTDIEIGAFCNGELRGSERLQYVANPANRYECFLMVYGNAGDDITFRMYDHSTGLESELKSSEVVDFEVNGTVGDVINPYTIKFTSKHWIVDPSIYANNMTLIATLEIDGEEQYDSNWEIGAFCNGELRGSERLQYVANPADRYECFLMIYGNSGDNITFRLYDHNSEAESELTSSESISFEVNATIGDVVNPYTINFKSTEVHTQALLSGWNWYSTYIINEGEEGLANLEAAVGTNGIQIKNQTKFVNQASGNWYGTLKSTAVEDMFMIQLTSAAEISLEGYAVNPANYPITLSTNWKWISYPVANSMSVEEAFAGANPSNGDYVKSQKGFAQYYEGLGWTGTLKTMTPGMGYMYQNTSGAAKTFVYPSASMSKSINEEELELHWTPDETLYPNNMTVITTVEIEGVEQATDNIEIGAFCGDELRGSGRLQYVDGPANRYECFLMLYGNAGDNITFKIYDHATASELNLKTDMTVTFEANGAIGDVTSPATMNFSAGEIITAVANPVEGGTIEGAGCYSVGDNVTLKAIENVGYIFLNWTENGTVVSEEYEYSFVVESGRNLVANFGTVTEYWTADANIYPNNMTVITTVTIDDVEQRNARLEVGAFCGDELRGNVRLQYVPAPVNKYEAFIMIYGEDNDSISFKVYNHTVASVLDLVCNDIVVFKVNETIGSVVEPHNISFITKTDNPDEPKLDAPQNVKANAISTSSIIVTWDFVENANSYEVYRNDELIENVKGTNYMDEGLEYDTEYCYTVRAIGDNAESAHSEKVCVKTLGDAIEELTSSVNIYPNPVNDKLYIEAEAEIEEIVVYDVYGRIQNLRNSETQKLRNSIDVSNLNSGVYFVKVVTDNGEAVQRFIKK